MRVGIRFSKNTRGGDAASADRVRHADFQLIHTRENAICRPENANFDDRGQLPAGPELGRGELKPQMNADERG